MPFKKPAGGEPPEWKRAIDRRLSSLRAIGEFPFRVVKRQFSFRWATSGAVFIEPFVGACKNHPVGLSIGKNAIHQRFLGVSRKAHGMSLG